MRTSILFLFTLITLIGCTNDNPSPESGEWLISRKLVFDGGPGKDGIPSLDDPNMQPIGDPGLLYLRDDDLLVVYKSGSDIRAYSQRLMDWHKIINDQIGDDHVAITYCPLTGTGIGWGREINGKVTTFGVSGLLYETNLMPYDRFTDSYWSQMENQCVNGNLVGETPEFFSLVQMNFSALKTLLPNVLVSSSITRFERDYSRYPYGSYLTNNSILFPIANTDSRLHPKEVVRGVIINQDARVFRFLESGRALHTDKVGGKDIIVVSDKTNDLIVSFEAKSIGSTALEFTLIDQNDSALILEDQLGNKWDIFGTAVERPNVGEQLEVPYSYMGYWFSFADFYPGIKIFGE